MKWSRLVILPMVKQMKYRAIVHTWKVGRDIKEIKT